MKMIRFDSVGGAAGDMILAALAGLGADLNHIQKVLSDAITEDSFVIERTDFSDKGISGSKLNVRIIKASGIERGLHEIEHIIERSAMTPGAKELSNKVFHHLAHAEASVHQCHAHHVHFHEVGAVDSIVDILGSCMAFDMLGAEKVSFGPLPEGTGTFQCRHGIYPIPAPATLALLKGIRIVQTDEPFEMITPTGAALLTALPGGQNPVPAAATLLASACSFGSRKLNGRPNLLRATLLEIKDEENTPSADSAVLLETNLDDISGEILGGLSEALLEAGALDVWTSPIFMKKQRPAVLLSVLIKPADSASFQKMIFRETGTFGIRVRPLERTVLQREICELKTEFGVIRVKKGYYNGELVSIKPEYEDCLKLAREHGIPLKILIRNLKLD